MTTRWDELDQAMCDASQRMQKIQGGSDAFVAAQVALGAVLAAKALIGIGRRLDSLVESLQTIATNTTRGEESR